MNFLIVFLMIVTLGILILILKEPSIPRLLKIVYAAALLPNIFAIQIRQLIISKLPHLAPFYESQLGGTFIVVIYVIAFVASLTVLLVSKGMKPASIGGEEVC
ncbi:hypothetical protein [Bacillus sp. AFS040349]|uniref:hypothetical protein n=1 Tax=Bacillus sp. AFS040349 TaxID=2033502 RepID=UPI000BFC5674|nr:hypothetical protein [Bacillus sp. AFS040349]PGT83228.1 hypothetical protein COD11_12905 [Bacillus sp. AFS040349]